MKTAMSQRKNIWIELQQIRYHIRKCNKHEGIITELIQMKYIYTKEEKQSKNHCAIGQLQDI